MRWKKICNLRRRGIYSAQISHKYHRHYECNGRAVCQQRKQHSDRARAGNSRGRTAEVYGFAGTAVTMKTPRTSLSLAFSVSALAGLDGFGFRLFLPVVVSRLVARKRSYRAWASGSPAVALSSLASSSNDRLRGFSGWVAFFLSRCFFWQTRLRSNRRSSSACSSGVNRPGSLPVALASESFCQG